MNKQDKEKIRKTLQRTLIKLKNNMLERRLNKKATEKEAVSYYNALSDIETALNKAIGRLK